MTYICHLPESQMKTLWGENEEDNVGFVPYKPMSWRQSNRARTQANRLSPSDRFNGKKYKELCAELTKKVKEENL